MSKPAENKKEEPLRRKIFRDWKGCVTKASRNSCPEDAWYYLENLQPRGPANCFTVDDISAALFDYGVDQVYWSREININGTDYIISFATNGKVFAFNIGAGTSAQINAVPTLLSGTGSRMDQWKNQILLIIDSSGYYYWDGATFAKLLGAGVPAAGTDIAVTFNRVWIVNGRVLLFSGIDGFGGGAPAIPDATNYWAVANGAGFVNLTDPILRSVVTRLYAADGYLYYTGDSSIGVISDVYVPAGAVPPTPVFTNLTIQSSLGTDQPGSLVSENRELTLANRDGIWAVRGVVAERISEDIDGTWQYADFSQPIFSGIVSVNRIKTRAVLMKRLNDPLFGSNTVLCMYWDRKWWFANFGTLTILVPAVVSGSQVLYGFVGNKLFKLFSNTLSSPASIFMTPLWPMEDPLEDKQVIRAGFEITVRTLITSFTSSVDSVNGTFPFVNSASVGAVQWVNNSNVIVTWQNNALALVTWFSGQFLLYSGAAPGAFSKYVGITGSGQAQYQLSGVYMDYKLGAAW